MKKSIAFLLPVAVVLTMFSCQKASNSSSNAAVMFVNGCVGATSTTLSFNGTNLSSATSIAYLGSSGYQSITPGTGTLSANLTGVGALGSLTATLNAGASYSIFECGTVLADSIVLISDTLPAASGSYAYVRLVNTSSDTSATSITGAVGNTVVGYNVAYATASGFVQITPGTSSITAFNINEPGNVATLSNIQLSGGKIYTLMYSGNATQSVGFKLTLISNN
jgi:Domain of unknown function (DUF4397)